MLTMLSAFAQLERAFILARTKEGRERARILGRSFGPKFKLSQQQIAHARDLQGEGRGLREISALLGCHASTISRALQIQKEEEEIA
ncbi:DNA invertase Pin-like site-specific DNA recombinase [Bradyrhizobium algeriense]|uniref:DNA invertase Pin-like site-specific DNA recombinase n=1 Tax=Bradyrhizobium algeriense TaxID=634784 RepID=A0ABU8BND2_9BRAD